MIDTPEKRHLFKKYQSVLNKEPLQAEDFSATSLSDLLLLFEEFSLWRGITPQADELAEIIAETLLGLPLCTIISDVTGKLYHVEKTKKQTTMYIFASEEDADKMAAVTYLKCSSADITDNKDFIVNSYSAEGFDSYLVVLNDTKVIFLFSDFIHKQIKQDKNAKLVNAMSYFAQFSANGKSSTEAMTALYNGLKSAKLYIPEISAGKINSMLLSKNVKQAPRGAIIAYTSMNEIESSLSYTHYSVWGIKDFIEKSPFDFMVIDSYRYNNLFVFSKSELERVI